MQAYSRTGLAPVTPGSPLSSVSSRPHGVDRAVPCGPSERTLGVVTAAHALVSLLLEGLTEKDLAVFARRLLPHLQGGI